MFIINPYRYAATGPLPITDFYTTIHSSSLYFTLGPVGFNFSSSIHSSSLEFTLGYAVPTIINSIYNTVDAISQGTGSQLFIADNSIRNYVDLTVT